MMSLVKKAKPQAAISLQTVSTQNSAVAQCCAKISRSVAGCHD